MKLTFQFILLCVEQTDMIKSMKKNYDSSIHIFFYNLIFLVQIAKSSNEKNLLDFSNCGKLNLTHLKYDCKGLRLVWIDQKNCMKTFPVASSDNSLFLQQYCRLCHTFYICNPNSKGQSLIFYQYCSLMPLAAYVDNWCSLCG